MSDPVHIQEVLAGMGLTNQEVRETLREAGLTEQVVNDVVNGMQPVEDGMDDLLQAMHQAGFKPQVNTDEDFPPFKGEYAVTWQTLRPWQNKETQQIEAYFSQWKIGQTLSGETADNRVLTRFYRIGGNGFDGHPVTTEQITENLKSLCNDAFTFGVELDRTNQKTLEDSFANVIDQPGYVRAWYFTAKDDPDRRIQQFVVKSAKHLRKESRETAEGKTARAPF